MACVFVSQSAQRQGCAQYHGFKTMHSSLFDGSNEQLLNSRQVRDFFGGVSSMWLPRRLRNDPSFPRPIPIAKRFYWKLGDLKRWRDAQVQFAVVEKDAPRRPPPRPPQGTRWRKGDKVAKAAPTTSTNPES